MRKRRRWLHHLSRPVGLVITAAVLAVALPLAIKPPAALGPEAAQREFSADRALEILRGLLRESRPHVAGSAANKEIRKRISDLLRSWGYEAEIQQRFHCHPAFASCAPVENIIAVKPGNEGRKAVLLTAHYDSSWAGPGASDDGAGTAAVLEIARMAAHDGAYRNDLVFLITDGEELGLIGAHAFASHHELFQRVGVVINLEARGVTGPSTMFETGEGNRSLIRILSRELRRPVANSLAYEVYKRMPNDTDYSVYKALGVPGLNFAFTGGVALYHSRLDDVAHLDPGSLQHHGQNAWSLVTALADRDIAKLQSKEDAAYIDVFGRFVWHYPVSTASGITVLLTVLILLGVALFLKSDISPSGVILALLAQITVGALLVGGAWLLRWPLGEWVSTHPIEHPQPWAAQFALFALCAWAVWVTCKLFAHRIGFGSATLACWLSFAALALWLDFNLPAASFVVLIPMVAFFVGLLLDMLRWRSGSGPVLATFFGFTTAGYIALYHFFMLDVVLPFSLSHVKAMPLVLLLLPLLPACFASAKDPIQGWRPALVLAGTVIAAALFHLFIPGFSEDRPRGMNLVYREQGEGHEALVYLESSGNRGDPVFVEANDFALREFPTLYASAGVNPRSGPALMSRPALEIPALGLAGVEAVAIRSLTQNFGDGHQVRTLRLTLKAPVGVEQMVIGLPQHAAVSEAHVNGVPALEQGAVSKRPDRPNLISITHPGAIPIEVEMVLAGPPPDKIAVTGRRALPESLWAEFSATWPRDAQPVHRGFRAEIVSEFTVSND